VKPSPMVAVIHDTSGFEALQNEWNALLAESSSNTIFLTWEWLYEWWRSYAAAERLYILTLRDESGRLRGVAPFYIARVWLLAVLPVKVLRFIGDGSGDSEYLDFIVARGVEVEARRQFLEFLETQHSLWDVCVLHGIPCTSVTSGVAHEWTQRHTLPIKGSDFPCSVIKLPTTWDAYLNNLNIKFRWKLRSRLRKLDQEHKVELVQCTEPVSLEAYLRVLFDLHRQRWARVHQEGCFVAQRQPFYERMGRRFLETGWLRFYLLRVDGLFVAAQFGFAYGGKFYSLQEGFDPGCGQDSYGIVLRAYVLQDAIAKGIAEYDLLRGEPDYKTRWNTHAATCLSLQMGRRTVSSLVFIYGPVLWRQILDWGLRISPQWLVTLKRLLQERLRRFSFPLRQYASLRSLEKARPTDE